MDAILERALLDLDSQVSTMADEFPLLFRVFKDSSEYFLFSMPPGDMDQLGEEIAMAFARCSVPEAQISQDESAYKQLLMTAVLTAHNTFILRARSSMNSRDGAMFKLFHRTIITPKNLQALFCICDPDIRSVCFNITSTRQGLQRMLAMFADETSTWSLFVPAEVDGEAPTSFGQKHITNMATALLPRNKEDWMENDELTELLHSLDKALLRSFENEPPEQMLELLASLDWPAILQQEIDHCAMNDCDNMVIGYYDMSLFIKLHRWACRFLSEFKPAREKANNYNKAKLFLQSKLGSCHELLRTVLRRTIKGDLDEVHPIQTFLNRYMSCLVPVPVDRETSALVRPALRVLADSYSRIKQQLGEQLAWTHEQRCQMDSMVRLLNSMYLWQELHNETEEEQWKRIHDLYLWKAAKVQAAQSKRFAKDIRKSLKKEFKSRINLDEGELCSNCFISDKTLMLECNSHLAPCSRCRQIKYCSRKCQREHWKKAHQKQCIKVEGAPKTETSTKKSKP